LICDPSHIGGKSELLQSIAQKAFDLKYDGLMIETHCNPSIAWTDAKQKITPAQLSELLNKLRVRNRQEIEANEIIEFRSEITQEDEEIIRLLQERMHISEKIGKIKRDKNTVILQSNRWEELLKINLEKAIKANLSQDFSNELFKLIHQESIRIQAEIFSENNNDKED